MLYKLNSLIKHKSTFTIFFFINFARDIEDPSITISISTGLENDFLWNLLINKSLKYPPTKATLVLLFDSMYLVIRLYRLNGILINSPCIYSEISFLSFNLHNELELV